jgi:HSP20 family protein
MSDRWWKHRKKRRDPWFSDIFDEFDRIEHMMDEMMRQAFRSPTAKRRKARTGGPYVYGFSMTMGPDGKPVIKEFGNLRSNRDKSPGTQIREVKEETEPLIDIFEKDKEITILAQLQGARREDIHVDITETQVTIKADTPHQTYHKKLQLPALVDPNTAQTTYKNGILQIRLEKHHRKYTPIL